MRNKLVLLLAIVFAAVAAFGVYTYLEDVKEAYRSSGNFARVAFAKQKIPARAPVTEQMLEFREMPVEYIMPGAVVNLSDAAGKLARTDIYPGELLLTSKLIGRDDPAGGLSAKIEPGKRAVTLPVDNVSALHGLIAAGDHVDVMVTFDSPHEPRYTATSTIIQNVQVLAVNRITESTDRIKDDPVTVTLMVEPVQAQQIALAVQQGSIHLMLRAPEDGDRPALPMTKIEHFIR